MVQRILLSLALSALLAACGGGDDDPKPTGSLCPTSSTLTYDNFGQQFMQTYCTRCHASDKVGDARKGAPADYNFDTLNDVLSAAEAIDVYAAGGPDAVNTAMPPSAPRPSDEDRKRLGEWLACESNRQ